MAPRARVVVQEMVLDTIGQEPEVAPSQDSGLRRMAIHDTETPTSIIEAVSEAYQVD
jgi:hypothetical protein